MECLFDEAKYEEEKGNRDKAFNLYSQYIDASNRGKEKEHNQSNPEKLSLAYNNRGFLRYLKVDFDEALDDYTQCLTLNPQLAAAHYNRGTIHYRLGRFDEAMSDMKSALTLNPDFTDAKTGLERSLVDKQKKEDRNW